VILYGGSQTTYSGNIYWNDVWRFDPAENEWYFISGNQNSSNNAPVYSGNNANHGGRSDGSAVVLANDSVIFFGGISGYFIPDRGYTYAYNDLWRLDTTSQWNFVSGNQTTNAIGVYSYTGVGYPGARYDHAILTLSNDSIILFGGLVDSGQFGF